ncbi:Phytochrome-like protein cph1 [Acaryochloris thomasi RCC1774]|uniref:histidine kinase n=1 Tax=Acaryochloris thomasi RCC1774 TaxID=1764569 RepID=A0A2W1K0P2_9CYAN|nr:ATP-binding protein [Acaryochloris thomasi]PZD74171.1 Phytochrome-like protein cph1 [Acaryochloris thomasi RCC1774]
MVNNSATVQPVLQSSAAQEALSVLLVEDNLGDAFLIQGMLGVVGASEAKEFQLQHVERLGDAIATLKQHPYQVILLDLSLPDSRGLQSLEQLEQVVPSVPVVILTGTNDETLATQAVNQGAQDYLVKGQITQEVLVRSIRYAIERQRTDEVLRLRTLELEETNQELKRQAQQLADANADLAAFNHTVAHDLRNPLAGIKTACALLNASLGEQDGKVTRYLGMIQDYSHQMGDVFEGLLQLAQLSHSPLQVQSVDLSATAQMIVSQLKIQHPKRQVKVAIAPQILVRGDSRLLWMLLDHLVSNAWKFTHGCQPANIEVGLCQSSDLPETMPCLAEQRVYFVKDNGIGFNMQHSEQVFTPFQQLTPEDEGQGIGLAMARCIVARHGGQIWCNTATGQGATFYWTLPLPAAQSAA